MYQTESKTFDCFAKYVIGNQRVVGCIYVEDWTTSEGALINNLYLGTFNLTVRLLEAQITKNGPTVCPKYNNIKYIQIRRLYLCPIHQK